MCILTVHVQKIKQFTESRAGDVFPFIDSILSLLRERNTQNMHRNENSRKVGLYSAEYRAHVATREILWEEFQLFWGVAGGTSTSIKYDFLVKYFTIFLTYFHIRFPCIPYNRIQSVLSTCCVHFAHCHQGFLKDSCRNSWRCPMHLFKRRNALQLMRAMIFFFQWDNLQR